MDTRNTTVARPVSAGHLLPADISGDDLLKAIHSTPAAEYVLLDPAGALVGVLSLRDLDDAVRRR